MDQMEKRAFLAVVLSLAILIFWQIFFLKKNVPPQEVSAPKTAQPEKQTKKTEVPQIVEKNTEAPIGASFQGEKEEEVILETELYRATFSSYGGTLKSWKLKKYKNKTGKEGESIELVTQKDPQFYPFFLRFSRPALEYVQTLPYEIRQQTPTTITFLYRERKIKIERTYELYTDKYEINHTTKIWPQKEDFKGDVFLGTSEGVMDAPKHNILTAPYADVRNFIFHTQDKTTREKVSDLKENQEIKSVISWAGSENQYFISAFINTSFVKPYLFISSSQLGGGNIELQYPFYREKNEEMFELKAKAFFGPKEMGALKAAGSDLEEAINFGVFSVFCIILLKTLNFLYFLIPNYGVSIILLTVLIRILFHPLTKKSYVSMREMQRIQPQIAKIKEKFKDDKTQMNKEVMDLMRANKVNPLGGCLPLLVQMPVFFALYRVLYNAIELYQAPFFGWIQDLSTKDPYYVLPVLMGISMFVQQKMTPSTTMDPAQQKMMLFMPIIFSFFMIALPSGLVLYILFSTVLQLASQYLVNRDLIKKGL